MNHIRFLSVCLCASIISSTLFATHCFAFNNKRITAPTIYYDYTIVRHDFYEEPEKEIIVEHKSGKYLAEAIAENAAKRISEALQELQEAKEEFFSEQNVIEMKSVVPALVTEIDNVQNDKYIYYDIDMSDELQEYTQDLCKKYGINHKIAFGIMYVETRFQPDKISKTKDHGIMQINECNHENYKEKLGITDFLDAKQGILCGVYMLWDLKTNYGCDTEDKMIMSYPGVGDAWKLWEKGIYTNWYVDAVRKAMDLLIVRK